MFNFYLILFRKNSIPVSITLILYCKIKNDISLYWWGNEG